MNVCYQMHTNLIRISLCVSHSRRHYLVFANAYVAYAAREDDLAANRGGLISNWCYENRARGTICRI